MFNFKQVLIDVIEDNKEIIKKYAGKLSLIPEEDATYGYKELETRCYRLLAEYDRLVIYGIDGERDHLERLYKLFKDDIRVQFWLTSEMAQILPQDSNIWIKNELDAPSNVQSVFDYGDYRLNEKAKGLAHLTLIDDQESNKGNNSFLPGIKKEKQLCKLASQFIKEGRELTIWTLEEKTIFYIKGLMKGAGVLGRTITFALLDGYQDELLKTLKQEMYVVSPIIAIEKDPSWSLLKRRTRKYHEDVCTEIKNLKSNAKK